MWVTIVSYVKYFLVTCHIETTFLIDTYCLVFAGDVAADIA